MKVLYITHQLAFNLFGGAEVQLLKTMDYINTNFEDISVKLYDMQQDKIEDFDIVHIFNPTGFPYESFRIASFAKQKNIKVVVSPIYYEHSELDKSYHKKPILFFWNTFLLYRKILLKSTLFQYVDPYRWLESLFKISDIILPNTQDELNSLYTRFINIAENKCYVIPNGVDGQFETGDSSLFKKTYNLENFILFIGRIEPRKNIVRLIKAFRNSGLNTCLVIIGKIADQSYFEKCKLEANENVIFLPPINNDIGLLTSAYKAAKVVALPSFYETPGLVALEGGLAGANVVITEIGGTREYFGDYAWYINPIDENSIRMALISAYNTPKNSNLSKRIQDKYTWENVAKKTVQAYRLIM